MKKLFSLCAAIAFTSLLAAAESLPVTPADFRFRVSGDADVTMAPAEVDGKTVLKISNRTPRKAHTFGALSATLKLQPDTPYRLTFRAKGESVSGIVFAFGPNWKQRFALSGIKPEWKEFSFEFTPPAAEFNKQKQYPLSILSENVAKEALIADIVFAPVVQEQETDNAIIPDGSFEAAPVDVPPPGWHFLINRDAAVKIAVSEREAAIGTKSLLITNSSPYQPHVYGILSRKIRVTPGVKYRLTLQARGENAYGIALVLGSRWKPRFRLGQLPNAWKSFNFEFTPEKEDLEQDGTMPFRILSENIVDVAYLDDIKIAPAGGETIVPERFQVEQIYLLPTEGAGIELNLPSDPQHYHGTMPTANEFHAKLRFHQIPGGGLGFEANVVDKEFHTPDTDKFWNSDSLQLRFSPGIFRDRADDDVELVFLAPAATGAVEGRNVNDNQELTASEAQLAGTRTADGYRIVGTLSAEFLKANNLDRGFTINAVVNNVRDDNRREIAFLSKGIHRQKESRENFRLLPLNGKPQLFATTDRRSSIRSIDGTLYATGFEESAEWNIEATLTDSTGKAHPVTFSPVPPVTKGELLAIHYDFDLATIPEGEFKLSFHAPGKAETVLVMSKTDLRKRQLEALKELETRFEPLAQAIDRMEHASRYLIVPRTLIRNKLDEHREHLEKTTAPEDLDYYTRLGEWVIPELQNAFTRLEANYAKRTLLPATYTYLGTDKATPFDVTTIPAVDEKGNVTTRPFFFAGYGHFNPVSDDMPLLEKLGNNAFQMEIGPRSFFPASFDKVSLVDYEKRIELAMKRALENNMRICLLLSPHYHPGWWLEANPEAKSESGFLKYEIDHPAARDMIKRYLDVVIPILKDSPYRAAIHSLCLSNEPVYTGARLDKPFTRQKFFEYLEREYGSLAGFNQAAGTRFADWEAVADAGLAHPAVNYTFHRYKRAAIADWHAWMAGIVRGHWPEATLSSKIMVFKTLEPAYNNEAIDPELFAAFSDYNGNDNYMYHKTGRWLSDWYTMAMYHDLQRSIRNMPIVNSENHVIKDGDWQDIPYDHIYAATFEQFLQGVSGMMTWVWRAVTPSAARQRPDLPGNIYQRPGSILAQSTAILDGNRLAPEIISFANADAKIGILYSPTSYIQNPAHYVRQLKELYPAIAFTGHKIGFRTETQVLKGDFGTIRLLYLPACTHLPTEVIAKLKEFEKKGGKVVTVGEQPAFDQFGTALTERPGFAALPGNLPLAQLSTHVGELANAAQSLPLTMKTTPENTGVIYRIVPDKEGYLLNIVNYERTPSKIFLAGAAGKLTDLITTGDAPFEFELKPLELRFLRFTPNAK